MLLECPLYEDLRRTLFQTMFDPLNRDLSNEEKLRVIFSSTSFNVIRLVARIWHEILMTRQDVLYKKVI